MKNLNINEEFIQKITKGAVITLAALGIGTIVVKSNPKMDCAIESEHAHIYQTEDGFTAYRINEHKKSNNGLRWTENTVDITEKIELIDKNKLLLISENRNILENVVRESVPYLEYEYKTKVTRKVGKIWVPRTVRRFTTNPNEDRRYTGRAVTVTAQYKGYRIIIDENGKQVLEESPWVDDITLIEDMYPYFKLSDYQKWFTSDPFDLEKEKELSLEYNN